ncbi:hypothetical protein [Nioella nitratireducens]|uniref:hypothetical protein n=1 Tax=Nioella nitratireducens TaxID=1287720 RepID=UPI0008FD21C9|nr:hypothetical protein [Nioella nitratireducens]
MILTEQDMSYSCTTCPKTGRPCLAGLKLAKQLAGAIRASGAIVDETFEMTGHGALEGCDGGACDVVYRLCKMEISVFCGVDQGADPDQLQAFANAFLGGGPIPSSPIPRAMIVAERRTAETAHAHA